MTTPAGRVDLLSAGSPYGRRIGVVVEEAGADRVRVALPHLEGNANRNGTLHGGVIASLVDVAGALAAQASPTIDLAIQFVAAAIREPVVAEARVERRGREIVFVRVEVRKTDGRLVASGLLAAYSGSGRRHDDVAPGDAGRRDLEAALAQSSRSARSPFSAGLGIRVTRLPDGGAIALQPWSPDLADDAGGVHEGVLATLVDCAGGAAAWHVDGFDARGRAATIAMHLCFTGRVAEEDVVAVARPAWRSGDIYSIPVALAGRRSGRAAGTGTVTYRIARPAR